MFNSQKISRKIKISLAVFFTAMALPFFTCGCVTNPVSGEKELNLFGSDFSQDVAMGKKFAPQVHQEMGGPIPNNSLNNYVNSVGQRLAAVSHAPQLEWEYKTVDSDEVNAFALPGGYIYITRGLLEVMETEAQLAAILGHESAHVTWRHSAQQMSSELVTELVFSIATTDETRTYVQAARLAAELQGLRYSRKQEKQADLTGTDYLVKAGYDAFGMVEAMQILEKQGGERPLEFFSTHPNPENRVKYITDYIIENAYSFKGKVGRDDYRKFVLDKI